MKTKSFITSACIVYLILVIPFVYAFLLSTNIQKPVNQHFKIDAEGTTPQIKRNTPSNLLTGNDEWRQDHKCGVQSRTKAVNTRVLNVGTNWLKPKSTKFNFAVKLIRSKNLCRGNSMETINDSASANLFPYPSRSAKLASFSGYHYRQRWYQKPSCRNKRWFLAEFTWP